MAYGDDHAKKIVLKAAKKLVSELQNGNSGCPQTQGRAIALIVEMIAPLYMAKFITINQCDARHKKVKQIKTTRIKLGPFEVEGHITSAIIINTIPLICCGILGFVFGKSQGWW